MKYMHLQQAAYSVNDYVVEPLQPSHMPEIRRWRNEQMSVLRQSRPLTEADQSHYYRSVVVPSFSDPETRIMLFGYSYVGELIGYGGLTNIDWNNRRAEISFLLETSRSDGHGQDPDQYRRDFSHFLLLMRRIAFKDLKLQRLFTETYDIRPLHIQVLENSGFILEGRMRDHVRIGDRYVDSLIHGCLKETEDV
ncbi:GNAT family N-acetyltransferase [Cohnella hongkongensis]|uniref:GNAT family N-acetyltransferase n=1 Tax=Cohnella hongkongensis TaxID=178337 RepID=A0ABV9FF57_9BACL